MKILETITKQEMSMILGGHWEVEYDENGNPHLYWVPDEEQPNEEDLIRVVNGRSDVLFYT